MKNSLEGFKGKFEQTQEGIRELQDTTMEILKSEEQKEKRLKEREQTLGDLWDTIQQRKRQREYLKKIMIVNFLNLMEGMNINNHKAHRAPGKNLKETHSKKHSLTLKR